MTMRFAIFLPVLFLLPASAAAQRDTIYLTDGTEISRVLVQEYDFKKIVYRKGRGTEETPREKVHRVEVGQTRAEKLFKAARKFESDDAMGDAYKEWLKAGDKALESQGTVVFAQFAFWRAFELAQSHGTIQDRRDCLDRLEKKTATTAFWPDIWRYRIEGRRAAAGNDRKRLEALKAYVKKFKAWVEEQGLSQRYVIEGDLYMIDARALLREIDAKTMQDELSRLQPRVEGVYPDLANRVNLAYASAVLAAKKSEDARKLFTVICNSKVADDETKAQAFVGRGHTWLRKSGRSPEDAKKALLDYMRVVTLFPDADDEILGEALYHAIMAYNAWNGPDKQASVRRLNSRLKIRYGDSSWAKKGK